MFISYVKIGFATVRW